MGNRTPDGLICLQVKKLKGDMRNMKYSTLILAASIALCLLIAPALSSPTNQSASSVLLVKHSGSGFAINGSDYHVLKIAVLGISEFNSSKIDNLISDNKTLGEIKSEIKDQVKSVMDNASYDGILMLGGDLYKLSNITSKTKDYNNSTIDAEIAGPAVLENNSNSTSVVGHISLDFTIYENNLIGKGDLTMNLGKNSGKYDALILADCGEFHKKIGHCRVKG